MRCEQHVNVIRHHHEGVQRVVTDLAIAKRVDDNLRDFRAAQMEGPRPALLEETIHRDERLTGGNARIREGPMPGQARVEPPG